MAPSCPSRTVMLLTPAAAHALAPPPPSDLPLLPLTRTPPLTRAAAQAEQRRVLREQLRLRDAAYCPNPPPLPPSRTDWTRLVPPPILTGQVSSLLPY